MAKETAGVMTSTLLYWDFKARGAVMSSNALFKGALHMQTPYIVYLNDDTVPKQQDWLKLMIKGLEQNPKFGFASPSGECSTQPQRGGKPGDPFAVHVVNKPLAWFVAVIKRECLEDVGLFWEQLIHYGDESDWIKRAFKKGWKQIWTEGVYIRHLKGSAGENHALRNTWASHDKKLYRRRHVHKGTRKKQGGTNA
jgi:GT2 family glycosyltransferase